MDKALSRQKFARRAIVQTGIALTLFYVLAVLAGWYRTHPWIDIPQHLFGGVLAGLIFYAVAYHFPNTLNLNRNYFFVSFLLLGTVALGGVIWEFMEFFYDGLAFGYWGVGDPSSRVAQLDIRDTMGDLFFNLVGGLALGIFMRLRYDKRKRQL